jgi:MinD superfamily P-loop ATPase
MEQRQGGLWFRSDTRFGRLVHAHLFAGEENSGKLVTLVKQEARTLALELGAALLLVDGPPGIGCPVISAVAGADLALLVVEPTVSGVHDLARALATTNHFGVPALVAVNKADLNPVRANEIAAFCAERDVPIVGRVPYNTITTEAMVNGQPVTVYADGDVTEAIQEIWRQIKGYLD